VNTAAATIRGNFVMVRADELRLLLPQQDVGVAEYLEGEPLASGEEGVFQHGEGESARAVVALSRRLRPLARFPRERFLMTRLRLPDLELSLAWNEVRVLIDATLAWQPLPPALRLPGAPIDGFVEHEGELLLCSDAERLLAFAVPVEG
jgi:hypothetical protein